MSESQSLVRTERSRQIVDIDYSTGSSLFFVDTAEIEPSKLAPEYRSLFIRYGERKAENDLDFFVMQCHAIIFYRKAKAPYALRGNRVGD